MQNILENLNKEQLCAVKNIQGTQLVIAGAGSGKTKVLTTRIAHLLQNGVSPSNILAVTFTNKAAKEMRERLSLIAGADAVKYMWGGTFHSICGRILRRDIDKYKFPSGRHLDKNFTVYDEQDSLAVIKQTVKKLNFDEKIYAPKLIKSIISNAKNKMQDAYTFATFARDFKGQRISQIFDEYERVLNNNNAMDFDDMLMLCVKLLEQNEEVRNFYDKRFRHILVDEFQDTNPTQYNLIKLLYGNGKDTGSLCVVGDADQSIYSWRGADFRIILNFKNDFKDCKLVKLEQNYRSTEKILKAANSIIENNEQRVEKVLYSNKGEGEKITYYEAADDADEANFIASTIKRTSADYNRFAVLYRTNAQSRSLEEACISMGIPYRIYGGLKFYDRKEIKDAIAYLKLIYNVDDSQSLKRIINVPKRAIGDTTIKHLQEYADKNDLSLYRAIEQAGEIETIRSGVKIKLEEFAGLIKYFRDAQSKYQLHEFIGFVLEKSGYLKELQSENTPENEARIENLQELVNVAGDFTPEDPDNSLGEFLSQVALVSDLDGMDEIGNNVTLMTLHSAKGLEFPTVFVAGLEDGIFPHARTFNTPSELEEERRLMYVGVTRAEEKLYLTRAKRRQLWGEYKYYGSSRFIDEIPNELIEYIESSGYTGEKTFKSAVRTIKSQMYGGDKGTNQYYSGAKSFNDSQNKSSEYGGGYKNTISQGAKKLGSPQRKSFDYDKYQAGKNGEKSKNVYAKHSKSILVKSDAHKKRDEERIKAFFSNNPMKRKVEEYKKKQEERAVIEEQREIEKNTPIDYFFNKGERVFHDKLGVGYILDVVQIGESTMYTIDFGKMGKKAMDAAYAHLKKF